VFATMHRAFPGPAGRRKAPPVRGRPSGSSPLETPSLPVWVPKACPKRWWVKPQHGLAALLRCRIDWTARGSIGADSNKILHRLVPSLPEPEADVIILSVGVNDVTGLTRLSRWQRNLNDLLVALHRHSPRAIVAVAGIPPLKGFPLLPQPLRALFGLRGKTFDRAAWKMVSRYPWAVYVPLDFDPTPDKFSADGYHPSEKSYREFGLMMATQISKKIDKP
jgi:lysophospholipase L1-like esterase